MNRVIQDASELRRLIAENPDLPIVVLCNSEMVADDYYCLWYANSVKCDVGIILDVELPFKNDKTYTDEDEFQEDLEEWLWDEMCEEEYEPDEAVFEEAVKEKMKYYEPYWKKVIEVWCDN